MKSKESGMVLTPQEQDVRYYPGYIWILESWTHHSLPLPPCKAYDGTQFENKGQYIYKVGEKNSSTARLSFTLSFSSSLSYLHQRSLSISHLVVVSSHLPCAYFIPNYLSLWKSLRPPSLYTGANKTNTFCQNVPQTPHKRPTASLSPFFFT